VVRYLCNIVSLGVVTLDRDRRKLTFYFVAERRIDFRELVRDLFKIYKTRIWMCAVDRNRLLPKQTRYIDPYQGVEASNFM